MTTIGDRISELPAATEPVAGNDLLAVTNVSAPGTGKTEKRTQDELLASQLNLNFRTATELTISGGAITVTQSNHKLQPESGTTDDLTTINGMTAGKILVLYVSDAGTDTITIKHGTGNISCLGATDVALSHGSAIFYSDGTTVYLIGGGGGGGAGVTFASIAETSAATETAKAVTPDGLGGSCYGVTFGCQEVFPAATALATGDGKAYIGPMPAKMAGFNLVGVLVQLFAKSTSGTPTVQIARGRQADATTALSFVDMLSTLVTVDAGEFSSKDATTPAVVNTANDDILEGDLLRVDVDAAGTGATGMWVTLYFGKP